MFSKFDDSILVNVFPAIWLSKKLGLSIVAALSLVMNQCDQIDCI